MIKTLNDALNDAKYPEFTNRLFDCLVVPFGVVQPKEYKGSNRSPNYIDSINHQCLEEDIYDSLLGLAKYKIPKTLTKKKHIINNINKNKKTKTQKNAHKREQIINQIHSIY